MHDILKVVMVSSECSGFAKVGGLGDVVMDLSAELVKSGHQVSVILPYYRIMKIEPIEIASIPVFFGSKKYKVNLFLILKSGVRFYFIDNHDFFGGKYSEVYIDSNLNKKGPFEDDAKRFAFFSKAAAEVLSSIDDFTETDILQCHDWHCGYLLTLLKYHDKYITLSSRLKKLFTIHNLNYQGVRPYILDNDKRHLNSLRSWDSELFEVLLDKDTAANVVYPADVRSLTSDEYTRCHNSKKIDAKSKKILADLYKKDGDFYRADRILTEEEETQVFEILLKTSIICFNPMRAAINLSDMVNTVSKTYASEIIYPSDHDGNFVRGCGLENDLKRLYDKKMLSGIVNGIDYDQYNPLALRRGFNSSCPDWSCIKYSNKEDLLINMYEKLAHVRKKIGAKFKNYNSVMKHLNKIDLKSYIDKPLIVSVGRASNQKVGVLFESYAGSIVLEEILRKDAFFIFVGSGEYEKNLEILNQHDNSLYITAFEFNLGIDVYSSGDLFFMPSYYEPCGISQLIAMRYAAVPVASDVGGLKDTIEEGVTGFKYSMNGDYRGNLLRAVDRAVEVFYSDNDLFTKMQKAAMGRHFGWKESANQYSSLYEALIKSR